MYLLIWCGMMRKYDCYENVVEAAKTLTKDEEVNKKALIIVEDSMYTTQVMEICWVYGTQWSLTVFEY